RLGLNQIKVERNFQWIPVRKVSLGGRDNALSDFLNIVLSFFARNKLVFGPLHSQFAGTKARIVRFFDLGSQTRPQLAFAILQLRVLKLHLAREDSPVNLA